MDQLQHREILMQLERVNAQLARQGSLRHALLWGVAYGVGFFIGSAILAVIVFGLVGPWFGQIGWIHDAFVTGEDMIRH